MEDGNAVAVGSDCSEDHMNFDAASLESSVTLFTCNAAASQPVGWRRDHLYAEDLPESSFAHAFLDGQRGADQRLIDALGTAIDGAVTQNERRIVGINGTSARVAPARLTPFHGLRPPPITITAYLRRILQYSKCSPVCFVMTVTYLERLAEADPAMMPTPLNVHRLLITGVLLAAKLMDDNYFNNAYYAKIGGVGVTELNRLELEMMRLLDYRLRVPACTIDGQVRFLLSRAEGKAGQKASSGLLRGNEDAGDAMVESPQSSAAGAGLSRVASQESVAGASPRSLPADQGLRERAVAGTGPGLGQPVGPASSAALTFHTGHSPLSFVAAVTRPRLAGGSPPNRHAAGGWQYQPTQQSQPLQQQKAAFVAAAEDELPLPGARQPSWPPMSESLAPALAPAVRSPSVPLSAVCGNAVALSFAAVVAAPKRGRGSIDAAGSGSGSRWQPAVRSERPLRHMASAAAAAAHMTSGHVQRLPEGIKAC